MGLPKVSICVPVYNTEQNLTLCLDSLLSQTLKHIEIIIVNDGSTDASGTICEEYARKDERVKLIHKENGGLASARQVGLNEARGEYYAVCDSDDWVEPNMYEELYRNASEKEADIILSNYFINYPNGKEIVSSTYNFLDQEQYICDLISSKVYGNTWSKLFRLDTIKRYNISYEKNIDLGEDLLFLYKILLNKVTIVQTDGCYYHYRRDINSDSYTNRVTEKSIRQYEFVWRWAKCHYADSKHNKAHMLSAINVAFAAIRAVDISDNYFISILDHISLQKLFEYRICSLKSIFVVIMKISGPKIGKIIYRLFYMFFYK